MIALVVMPKIRRNYLWRWIVAIAAMPILLLVIVVGALGYRELNARHELRGEIERLRTSGKPVDNESMAVWFQANTSQEGTAAWCEILALVSGVQAWGIAADLPIVGSRKLPVSLVPGGDWPEESRVSEFLLETKPVIDLIHKAVDYPTPVWQPMHFEGFQTHLPELQESRSVARLLELEVEYACYNRQTERALEALISMQGVEKAFDWKLCLVSDSVTMALRYTRLATIRRTLGADIWNTEHIAKLMQQVDVPINVVTSWTLSMSGERGMALADVEGSSERLAAMLDTNSAPWLALLATPRSKLNYLRFFRDAGRIPTAGLDGLDKRAKAFQEKLLSESSGGILAAWDSRLARLLMPSLEGYAAAHWYAEFNRRLTLTALAVKRFQVDQGRWPKQLSELEQVGLETSDWTALEFGPLNYQVVGKEAVVWGLELAKDTAISAQPPKILSSDDAEKYWYVTTIR